MQDQPVDADPNVPGPEGAPPKTAIVPSKEDKALLGRFTRGYIPVFCDAFIRLLKRDKRDLETISTLLRPIFRSIADASMEQNGSTEAAPETILDDLLKSVAHRAAKWPAKPDEPAAAELAREEFLRALRSIHINVSREAAAARAAQEIAS
jgi:hypothetical protein